MTHNRCAEQYRKSFQSSLAESKPTGFVPTSLSLPGVREDMPTRCPDVKTQSSLISEVSVLPPPVMNVFARFIHEGLVSLSDMSDPTPTKILRDIGASQSKILRNTGASQSLLLSDTLSFSEESSVGASVLIREINC